MSTRMLRRLSDGTPVVSYEVRPGLPAVSVTRFEAGVRAPEKSSHAHDFVVLCFFEDGGGSVRTGGQPHLIAPGDVCVVTPGQVVSAHDHDSGDSGGGWLVFFPPEVLRTGAAGEWRSHPLLSRFVNGATETAQWLNVPEEGRYTWSQRFQSLERELKERRDGYRDAVLAHLTLLLVDTARLGENVVRDLQTKNEPLLAAVFAHIEDHYAEPLALTDIARAVGLTPGHVTTTVKNKTGRTVGEWIVQRRMAAARRLLADTVIPIEEVARHTGFTDPGYFTRIFRRNHGTTPLNWRRSGNA
ncbi:AraC family transcriptional regulator [Hoyosella subflava]|nr:AraC family transcriptional regulator [Hoyosella subflava]